MGFAEGFLNGLRIRDMMDQRKEADLQKKLTRPFFDAAINDMKDTVQANPSYDLFANMQNKTNNRNLVNTNFAPQYNTSSSMPLLYKKGLSPNSPEFVQKHTLALTQAGIKPSALPFGMRTGEENRTAALIDGALALNAKQAAEEKRLNNFGLFDRGRQGAESNVKYGTGEQLEPNLNAMKQNLGVDGFSFGMPKTTGFEVNKANSKIATDQALIDQRNSATWRNMNKPLIGSSRGDSSGKSVTPGNQFKTDQDWNAITQHIANAPTREEYIKRLNTYEKSLEAFHDAGYNVENAIQYWNNQWLKGAPGSAVLK